LYNASKSVVPIIEDIVRIDNNKNKANTIVENSMDPVSPNKPTDNQTPTEFVHELESTSPMNIIPDDE